MTQKTLTKKEEAERLQRLADQAVIDARNARLTAEAYEIDAQKAAIAYEQEADTQIGHQNLVEREIEAQRAAIAKEQEGAETEEAQASWDANEVDAELAEAEQELSDFRAETENETESETKIVQIDGREYDYNTLSKEAKETIESIVEAETEMVNIERSYKLATLAHASLTRTLTAELSGTEDAEDAEDAEDGRNL